MPYHKGAAPKNALLLMKSRYCAYATQNSNYIIKTTHKNNDDFTEDKAKWNKSIKAFCTQTEFLGLEIIKADLNDDISYVTFKAKLSTGDILEKSRFVFEDGVWLYESGDML
ncbi:MAG: Unknown protein [uncultured Campylobacterales bacterium]|uniref:YchJ-like middle NTF2-like domain-containing protein n=1 Tax=uncultured Campylobacterales bacterium TaxID=352960 RepID=A0A6S6S137_9BACT|nr:MAG: Unknown protein [uncultured Campylobacterales bacterium]